jgi:hypothetical protein
VRKKVHAEGQELGMREIAKQEVKKEKREEQDDDRKVDGIEVLWSLRALITCRDSSK